MKTNIKELLKTDREGLVTFLLIVSFGLFILGYHALSNIFIAIALGVVIFLTFREGLLKKINDETVIAFASYFLLTLIGTAYSSDISAAFGYVERRLLIIFCPLLFSGLSLSEKYRKPLLRSIIVFTSLGLVIGFISSAFDYQHSGDSGFFYNDNLVDILSKQAPYYGLFINTAIVLIRILKDKIAYYCLPILITGQFFLAVRLSILLMLLLFMIWFLYEGYKRNYKIILAGIAIMLVVMAGASFLFPQTAKRFLSITQVFEYQFDNPNPVNHFNGEIKEENWNGLTIRLALWHCGMEIIGEQPVFGVGTGDYMSSLRKKFEEKNFVYALERDFGIHNQYIYTCMTFGIVGLLMFLVSYGFLIRKAVAGNNFEFPAFLFIVLISFLTENIFNRYYGIYYVSFVSGLLFYQREKPL